MSPASKGKSAAVKAPQVEIERAEFLSLLTANPNHFGNLSTSIFKPVKKMAGNTKYEQITCVGFNPELDQLEATVHIKLSYGYGGGQCATGSNEYVRFFIDYGSGWEDLGVSAFHVNDIPDGVDCAGAKTKPLSYVASVSLKPPRKLCGTPVLPKVRAVLSWNSHPSANPNDPPVWGNVLDRHIQIRPRRLFVKDVADLVTAEAWSKLKVPPLELQEEVPIPIPDPGPLNVAQLAARYVRGRGRLTEAVSVEPHRFALAEIKTVQAQILKSTDVVASTFEVWKGLGLDWSEVVAALDKTKGDVSYEELTCVGLDTNRSVLSAGFVVKRPFGYSGGLCEHGSTEHVAFWVDWDDSCSWSYLGTAEVRVHDIASIPAGGLHYAALLPVDLETLRRHCSQPRIGRIRAVLSWNAAPSTTDPDAVPHWGNRKDTHVNVPPGIAYDDDTAIITTIGGIPVGKISAITGLTKSDAFFASNGLAPDAYGRPCPFGGRVVIKGPQHPGKKYRVEVRRVGDVAWVPVTTTLKLVDWTGTFVTINAADASGDFDFVPFDQNFENVLAWWDTGGDDLWEVRLVLKTMGGAVIDTVTRRVQLDNTAPETDIHIDSGGDCKDFTVTSSVLGHFVARDTYFGSYVLYTSPYGAPAGQLLPGSGTVQTAVAPGDPWSLDTDGMKPCGYVVVVEAWDRAIVNSAWVGHRSSRAVGFCLRK